MDCDWVGGLVGGDRRGNNCRCNLQYWNRSGMEEEEEEEHEFGKICSSMKMSKKKYPNEQKKKLMSKKICNWILDAVLE